MSADRFRAFSAALHCIAVRHAAPNVCLALAAYSAVEGARFLRGGCMHAASLSVTWLIEEWIVRSRWEDMETRSTKKFENVVLLSASGRSLK